MLKPHQFWEIKNFRNRTVYVLGLIYVCSFQLSAQIRFEVVTEEAGLLEPLKGTMGHGSAWGDVNGDGFPDLFIGTFADRPDNYNVRGHTTGAEPDKLFINQGDGTFKEVMDSPIRIYGRCSGAAFADFDNDGDLDLVVSHYSFDSEKNTKANNFLFENDGTGVFTDVTEKSNLNFGFPFSGRNTFVFDYDGDGRLDLLMQEDRSRADVSGGNSRLMKNLGGLVFKDVTADTGLPHGHRKGLYGLGGFVGDLNGDSWPDIFFAHSCRTFINNKNGTFHEKDYKMVDEKYTKPASVIGEYNDWTCGADLGDIDNDGDMDMVMGDHFNRGEKSFHSVYLFLNEGNDASGDPIFRNITADAGIASIYERAPHVQLQDIDNDGKVDIFVSSDNTLVYKNIGVVEGIPKFDRPLGAWYTASIGYWASAPLGDYDRDGRLDVIALEWKPHTPSPLFHNITQDAEHYIDVMLDLKKSGNRNGIGAKVELFAMGRLGQREGLLGTRIISVSNGYSSGYEAIAHFGNPHGGLRGNEAVDLRITMPTDGEVYEIRNVKGNQLYVFKE